MIGFDEIKLVTFDGPALANAEPLALGETAKMVMIGYAGDQGEALRASQRWRVVWDIVLTESDAGVASPAFWRAARARVEEELGVSPSAWLHVAAPPGASLAPAREAGLATGMVSGFGASLDLAGEASVVVSGLTQLEFGLRQALGAPVRYEVTAEACHEKYARSYVTWMRNEHGRALLDVPGCLEFRTYRVGPTTVRSEYLFRNQAALDRYVGESATELRQKARELFPEGLMTFSRAVSTLEVSGERGR